MKKLSQEQDVININQSLYQLVFVIFKSRSQHPKYITAASSRFHENEFFILTRYGEKKISLNDSNFAIKFQPKYLIFQKESLDDNMDAALPFLNNLFINLFYFDKFFTKITEKEEEYSWNKTLIKEFKKADKNSMKNKDSALSCCGIAKEYLKISSIVKSPEKAKHNELLLKELIEEMHLNSNIDYCECSCCLYFRFNRIFSDGSSEAEYFFEMQLDNSSTPETVSGIILGSHELYDINYPQYIIIKTNSSLDALGRLEAIEVLEFINYTNGKTDGKILYEILGIMIQLEDNYASLCYSHRYHQWKAYNNNKMISHRNLSETLAQYSN